MVKRSLQASPSGVQLAKRAFAIKGWTQENLAGEVNLRTRQPIWRFFTGQPVDRQIFLSVCLILDLDWRDIADRPPAEFPEPREVVEAAPLDIAPLDIAPLDIDSLVQQVRSQHQETIQNQCGILQLLNISHPVSLDDIYVDVHLLEEISSQQWFEVADLQNLKPTEFDRLGLGTQQSQIAGTQAVETYLKLRVIGKPGAGKTTFLKHLAIQCDRGEWAANQVPIFIQLRDFAEESRDSGKFSLTNYIHQVLITAGVSNPFVLKTLLQEGRILLLLDGMDEVLNQDSTAVLKEIRKFSEKYYKNQFVVSSRSKAQKQQLQGFTDVEIAPFTQVQITTCVQKWFAAFAKQNSRSGEAQSRQFIQTLDLPENWQFRQMVVTPLFLHLACSMFQGQEKFSTKRADFYKQGLDLLLSKWDAVRGIERDRVYQDFQLPQTLRLLNQLAAVTFEQGHYFFEQHFVEQFIGDYLQNLSGAILAPEELQLDSETILKAIEIQHGILIERSRGVFSFSYLVFQEYFAAQKIVTSHSLQALEPALTGLVRHITDPQWREVFLLTTVMLRSADSLMQLMKQQMNAFVAEDPYLQEFLIWASQNPQIMLSPSKVATAQALCPAQPPPLAHDHNADCSWQFSLEQQQVLQHYYYANQLLIDCLNSDCKVTTTIRQDIEATLLPPHKELKREWQRD
ncbi:MAG: hypothetical protein Kow00121_54510 [Elainellaceae cyanobacterium]